VNFLAHIYLSGESDDEKFGNFIGDYVKGADYNKYSADVRKGILLHRAIDFFTDSHPVVRRSKLRFANAYHKYAGVIVDIFYDHILAVNWNQFYPEELTWYTERFYYLVESRFNQLPKAMQGFITSLLKNDWLMAYSTFQGIEKVLKGMSLKTSLPDETDFAMNLLHTQNDQIAEEFFEFFPHLINHVEDKFAVGIHYPRTHRA
jgi:acyl carrier protein phosphodiesterase